jgi:hypothetical protein
LERRRIAVFGADLWASNWNPMTPEHQLRLVLERLSATGGGIVLLHDTKLQTANMLAPFLRALKGREFRIVHVVPATSQARARGPMMAALWRQWYCRHTRLKNVRPRSVKAPLICLPLLFG